MLYSEQKREFFNVNFLCHPYMTKGAECVMLYLFAALYSAFPLAENSSQLSLLKDAKCEFVYRYSTGEPFCLVYKKVKQSRYTPWRRLGGEEV
jgi:hypothetical protein